MPKLTAKTFFTAEEQKRIEQAVEAVEERTSGEIVPMVIEASYDYPRTEILGAGFFSLATAVFLAWLFGNESIWVFLPLFFLFYFPFKLIIKRTPALKRRLTHPAEIDAEVEEKALVSFLEKGLYRTRDETGILILISLLERRVHVLADRGINAKVPPRTWDEIVETVVAGIKAGRTCDALCTAIGRCGDLLEEHFPVRADDTDELPNLIID